MPIWRPLLVVSTHLVNGIERGIDSKEMLLLSMRRVLKVVKPILYAVRDDEATVEKLTDFTVEASICYNVDTTELVRLLQG